MFAVLEGLCQRAKGLVAVDTHLALGLGERAGPGGGGENNRPPLFRKTKERAPGRGGGGGKKPCGTLGRLGIEGHQGRIGTALPPKGTWKP